MKSILKRIYRVVSDGVRGRTVRDTLALYALLLGIAVPLGVWLVLRLGENRGHITFTAILVMATLSSVIMGGQDRDSEPVAEPTPPTSEDLDTSGEETCDPAIHESSRSVQRWRAFLIHSGRLNHHAGSDELAKATEAFQREHQIAPTKFGTVDDATLQAAKAAGYPAFVIGPDIDDIRERRTYFMIPLLELSPEKGDYTTYFARIKEFVRLRTALTGNITDIYVISHGWHRNLFAAVAAYDRIMSRFSALFRRGRLEVRNAKSYNPLFIALHWHADPGKDAWVDLSGRRDKLSYLANVRQQFTVPAGRETEFVNDFENMFEFFTRISAPGVDAVRIEDDEKARRLMDRLAAYDLSDGRTAYPSEKAAMAWRCYDESAVKRVLASQGIRARPYNSFFQAILEIAKYLATTVGIATLFGLLSKLPTKGVWPACVDAANNVRRLVPYHGPPVLSPAHQDAVHQWMHMTWGLCASSCTMLGWHQRAVIVVLVGLLVLISTAAFQSWFGRRQKAGTKGQGFPILAVVGWAPVQLACLVLLAIPLLMTYLVGGIRAWLRAHLPWRWPPPRTFDEKQDLWDWSRQRPRVRWYFPRYWLAALARVPIKLLNVSLSTDSPIRPLVDGIDNQLAFYEMQVKAAAAGVQAAELLNGLLDELDLGESPSIHLIGHSFGSLVVANLARTIGIAASQREVEPRTMTSILSGHGVRHQCGSHQRVQTITSICLLQGTLASNWFDGEAWVKSVVKDGDAPGRIASIFSGYDTANGFYYPVANSSRMAAGYVGLYRVGDGSYEVDRIGEQGEFASLVTPPKLIFKHPPAISLDASRIIYEGPAVSGGGHGDVFKDDVINLIWAVTNPNS